MYKKPLLVAGLLLSLAVVSGCAHQPPHARTTTVVEAYDPVIIRVEGHGAPGQVNVQTNPQQDRLLAMRASKMDAYRNLAERVYGTRIQGNTTVRNFASRDDNVRGYVDNIVRGAKVLSTAELSDGTFVTEMELVLAPRLQRCIAHPQMLMSDPFCQQHTHTVHGEHVSQRLPVQNLQPGHRVYYYSHPEGDYHPRGVRSAPGVRYHLY